MNTQFVISTAIECPLMDSKNISNLIEQFTTLTPLQSAWKRFCEEKSMFDSSKHNDYLILSSIKDPQMEDSIFQFDCFNSRKVFISEYCTKEIQEQIIEYILSDFNYTFFNASLIFSLYKDEDYCCEDYCCLGDIGLALAEQEFDNYDGDSNEEEFEFALINASLIKLVTMLSNNNLITVKKYFDLYFTEQIPREIYERIWHRAIRHEDELYGDLIIEGDNEEGNEEDNEFEDNLAIEQAETLEELDNDDF